MSSATVADVARLAGCSTATVSRALNTPGLVREGVRERISQAVAELGFIPNNAARALRQNRTRLIGAVIPTLRYDIYAGFVEALQRTIGPAGFSLLLTTSSYDQEEEYQQALALVQRAVEGLVLVGSSHDARLETLLDRTGIPAVNTYVHAPRGRHSSVGFHNGAAIAQGLDALFALGHRRIGMIAGLASGNDRAGARIEGFRAAMRARDTAFEAPVEEVRYTVEAGGEAMGRLLAAHALTAVVCGSDMLALGAAIHCRGAGIPVPAAMSLLGFDDLELTRYAMPPLSTIRVDSDRIGQKAAEEILERCGGRTGIAHASVPTEVVLRGTTMAPADAARPARTVRTRRM